MYKFIVNTTRTGLVSSNNVENIVNITFKNMPKNEETKLYVTVKTEFKDNIEIASINPEQTVFLDKLSEDEFNQYLGDLKEKIFKVYADKVKEFEIISAKSSSTIIDQPGIEVEQPAPEQQQNQNQQQGQEEQQEQQNQQQPEQPQIQQPDNSTTNLTKEQVQSMVVNAIIAKSQEVVNNENRNITLNDLQNLSIDGETVSAVITSESATLTYKGFKFVVDSSFNIN